MVLIHHLPEIYVSVDLLNLLSVTITSSLLTCLLHITLVFPRCILRPTGLLMSWKSWSISCSFEVELAMRTISSAKIRWDKYSPSILTPLFSQLILLMMAYCRHDVNSLGEMLSPCLAPLLSMIFSLSLWSHRTDVASL